MARPYGTSPGDENRPAQSGSMRDANGNMVIVDGRVVGAHYSEASPDALTYGVGRGSATGASTNATAVGNLLNVNVTGNNNTVIVTSEQTNNGTQTVILNGGLKLSQ
jgi:holdfast attachment protein HfaA